MKRRKTEHSKGTAKNKRRVLRSVERWSPLEAAKRYIALGWFIFPIHSVDATGQCTCGTPNCSNAGKHPATAHGFKDATIDLAQIEQWFGPNAPPWNIGLVTGKRSGVTVIDKDTGPGKVGAATWAELIREHGEPQTLVARTGGGGLHLFFTYEASLKTGNNRLGQHIDAKNDGGYVIVAPSRHKSGGTYIWMNWGTPLAPMPEYLIPRKADDTPTRGRPRTDDPMRQVYTLDDVAEMLKLIPADDRDLWRAVGIILGREFKRSDKAWALYVEWSDKWEGEKASNHDKVMYEAFHEISQQHADNELSLGTIVKLALDHGWEPTKTGAEVPKTHLVYLAPENAFLNLITQQCWTAKAVDTRVAPVNVDTKLIPASQWIQRNQAATSITCTPALPEGLTPGYDCFRGRKVLSTGGAIFNLYRRTMLKPGDAKLAGPFVEHCILLFNKPGDAEQFLNFMAHRVQHPEEKPRFALLIAGDQGTGKDTAVDFCCLAIGSWNVASVNPGAFDSAFNEFYAATLIRINEVANRQDLNKFAFNERTKVLIAGNPDEAEVNPKYGKKYSVLMHCGVVLTTNSLLGIYIPPDDRRYDVLLCATLAEMGLTDDTTRRAYFENLWGWFLNGGAEHVYAFLLERDLTQFSASQGQRKTEAHKMTVQENLVNDEWFADALEAECNPTLFRGDLILERARSMGESGSGIKTKLAHAAERAGFIKYRSPLKDGRWKCADGWKCSIFIRQGTAHPTAAELKELLGRTMATLVSSIHGKSKY